VGLYTPYQPGARGEPGLRSAGFDKLSQRGGGGEPTVRLAGFDKLSQRGGGGEPGLRSAGFDKLSQRGGGGEPTVRLAGFGRRASTSSKRVSKNSPPQRPQEPGERPKTNTLIK